MPEVAHALEGVRFDVVAAITTRLVALWRCPGFAVVGRLRRACRHPALGPADAVAMDRTL